MTAERLFFGDFVFDPGERSLMRGRERLDLGSRYIDALGLLVRERGRLITKDRFMAEVWQGTPVTDEALTQCIRTLRSTLGDNAARPQFIETVPKHGYRFIAETQPADTGRRFSMVTTLHFPRVLYGAWAASMGGAVAGIGGGLLYGFTAARSAEANGMGAMSALSVLLIINILVGAAAGLGVGAGIALARQIRGNKWQWSTAGGMFGGIFIGGIVQLLGHDAISLLFGRSLIGITGPAEGGLLGGSLGLAVWVVSGSRRVVGRAAVGALFGGVAGLLTPLLGGHLLGGSLNLLAQAFPDARFRLDRIGALVGEGAFGRISEIVTATIEGGLFGLCIIVALALAFASQDTLVAAEQSRHVGPDS